MSTIMRAALLATVLVLGLAACDADGDPPDGPAGEAVTATFVAVDVDFAEAPEQLASGDVTVELVNDGALQHNVTIEGVGDGPVVSAAGGETGSAAVALEPGEYVAYCSISGHREAGMEATFTVDG